MGKLIVTHHHPDLDAIFAAWLLKTFLKEEYGEAAFAFVPAGQTYKNKPVDADGDVVHVDTGGGRFDHHDKERQEMSAGELVYNHLVEKQPHLGEEKALMWMSEFVTEIDHFGEYFWPEPLNIRYAFMLSSIVPSLHLLGEYSNKEVVEMVFVMLDGVYKLLKDYQKAKEDIEKGREVESSEWGRMLVLESGADSAMKVAQKMGYDVVLRKDPRTGFVKIKSAPKPEIDLEPLYDKIAAAEKSDRWFFHPSGHMILNGSNKNPESEPTSLELEEIVEMID